MAHPCERSTINPPPRMSHPSGRRRPNEPVLHEELGLLAGSPDQGERILVKVLSTLVHPRDSLFDCLHADRSGLARKDFDLVHGWDDVLLVETSFLRDEGQLLGGCNAHLVC